MPDIEGLHIRHICHIGHMYGPPTSLMFQVLPRSGSNPGPRGHSPRMCAHSTDPPCAKVQESDEKYRIVTVFVFNISLNPWKSDSGDQGSRNQEWGTGSGDWGWGSGIQHFRGSRGSSSTISDLSSRGRCGSCGETTNDFYAFFW